MSKISIYIAGSVRKDKDDGNSIFADDNIKEELIKALDGFELIIFDPNESRILGTTSSPRFGKDCLQVTSSNFIIVDLREKRGLGVGAEMMIAKQRNIPVIAVCPPESHYKRNIVFHNGVENPGWVHPFVECLCDGIVDSFGDAGKWIKEYVRSPIKTSSVEVIDKAIKDYLDNYLDDDVDFKQKYLDSLIDKQSYNI